MVTRSTPITLSELDRIVLAAELSTRPQFRGARSDDERLQQIAHEWFCRREGMAMRASVDDARVISRRVFYVVREPMRRLVRMMNKESMSDQHCDAVVDHVWLDDSPQYDPRPRRR